MWILQWQQRVSKAANAAKLQKIELQIRTAAATTTTSTTTAAAGAAATHQQVQLATAT